MALGLYPWETRFPGWDSVRQLSNPSLTWSDTSNSNWHNPSLTPNEGRRQAPMASFLFPTMLDRTELSNCVAVAWLFGPYLDCGIVALPYPEFKGDSADGDVPASEQPPVHEMALPPAQTPPSDHHRFSDRHGRGPPSPRCPIRNFPSPKAPKPSMNWRWGLWSGHLRSLTNSQILLR